MAAIFLSYRRRDSTEETLQLKKVLESRFGQKCAFRDVDSIPKGVDFRVSIAKALEECRLMIVIIGNSWLTEEKPPGHRRIDDPEDYVRKEIEAALDKQIPIAIVLIGTAELPDASDLPATILSLSFRNAVRVRDNAEISDAGSQLYTDIVSHLLSQEKVLLVAPPLSSIPAGCKVEEDLTGWSVTARWSKPTFTESFALLVGYSVLSSIILMCAPPFFMPFVADGASIARPMTTLLVTLVVVGLLGLTYLLLTRLFGNTMARVSGDGATVSQGTSWFRRNVKFSWDLARIEPRVGEFAIVFDICQVPRVQHSLTVGSQLTDERRLFLFWFLWSRSEAGKEPEVTAPVSLPAE